MISAKTSLIGEIDLGAHVSTQSERFQIFDERSLRYILTSNSHVWYLQPLVRDLEDIRNITSLRLWVRFFEDVPDPNRLPRIAINRRLW